MFFLHYLGFISLISGITFALDKYKARNAKWRIPESSLHMLEALGGVFIILLLMFKIRHKNAKKSYYLKTYAIFFCWVAALGYVAWGKIAG